MAEGFVRVGGHRRVAEEVLSYGFAEPGSAGGDRATLGPVPLLVRPLRLPLAGTPLVAPFGRRRQAAVREITSRDPRITRLWERFAVDVGVAVERDASFIDQHIFARPEAGYRVLILEDGDRYAIRAMCIFKVGYVMELLHDRSVAGMRAASHLLGLALREMSDAGAASAHAWSLPHSGSFPIFARHAFFPMPERFRFRSSVEHLVVRALDPTVEEIVTRRDAWYLSYLDSGL